MTIEKMLDLINDTPFSMLGYDDPNLAVTKDIKEKAKYNKALSSALLLINNLQNSLNVL